MSIVTRNWDKFVLWNISTQHNSSIEHRTLAPYSSDAVVALQNRQSCLWMRLEHALRCNDTGEAWRDLSITVWLTNHGRRRTCAYNNDVEADCILRRWHADGVLHARASRMNQGGRDGARLLLGEVRLPISKERLVEVSQVPGSRE